MGRVNEAGGQASVVLYTAPYRVICGGGSRSHGRAISQHTTIRWRSCTLDAALAVRGGGGCCMVEI